MEKNQIIVHYGTDISQMVPAVLKSAGLHRIIKPEMRICIKPNLVVGKPSSSGATTTPEIVEYIIRYLADRGCTNMFIGESSWVGEPTERAFLQCGYDKLAHTYGIPLIDLNSTPAEERMTGGERLIISKEVLTSELIINVPVLKGHCQVKMTCALKNMKGCIPNDEKRRYHRLGIHKPVAQLNAVLPPQFILVDAQQGDLTFEEGGTPVRMDRIIAGYDPVLIDSYCADIMGFAPGEIEYIRLGEEFGIGSSRFKAAEIKELGAEDKTAAVTSDNPSISRLASHVIQREACSACYGSVIHALCRYQERGSLSDLNAPLYVGQYYQDRSENGIGVGNCTRQFEKTIHGCPPTAYAILQYLDRQLG